MKHQLGLPEDYGIPDSDGEQGGWVHVCATAAAVGWRMAAECCWNQTAVGVAFMADFCLYPDLLQMAGSMRRLQRQLLRKQR